MIRIEAGLIFAGYEFDDQVDPFEAGIGFTVKLDTEDDFVGKEALIERSSHPQRKLVGPRARGQRDRRPRRRGVRGPPARGRGHERHAQPDAAEEHRALPDVGAVRGERAPPSRSGSSTGSRSGSPPRWWASRSTTRRRSGRGRDRAGPAPGVPVLAQLHRARRHRSDPVRRPCGGRAAGRLRRRPGPGGRAAPDARDVRDRRHGHHRAEGRGGARHDGQRVHVRLARAAARAHLGRPPDEDVRPAPRGHALRRQRPVRDPVGAVGSVRRAVRPRPSRSSRSSRTRRSWTARWRTSSRASSARTGAATTRCSSAGSSTRARTPGTPLLFHGGRYERLGA